MNNYPLSSAIILNDTIFSSYGGHVANSLPAQRDAAYWLAEIAAWKDLDTFLLPIIVTGTYPFYQSLMKTGLVLDNSYVSQIYQVSFYDFKGDLYWSETGSSSYYFALRDDTFGIIDINYILSNCQCTPSMYPYKIQVVYQAGFPTGTANRPDILMALATYADLILQEIIGYGNEAPGDIGVQRYQNQDYREERIGLLRTSYGSSARANFAHRLLSGLRKYRWCGL